MRRDRIQLVIETTFYNFTRLTIHEDQDFFLILILFYSLFKSPNTLLISLFLSSMLSSERLQSLASIPILFLCFL